MEDELDPEIAALLANSVANYENAQDDASDNSFASDVPSFNSSSSNDFSVDAPAKKTNSIHEDNLSQK